MTQFRARASSSVGGIKFSSIARVAGPLLARVRPASTATASYSTPRDKFYNDYGNIRSASRSAPDPVFHLPFPVFFENNLEGDTYGLELSANARLTDWWQLRADYRLLKENIHVKPGTVDINNALNETFDAENQFSVHSSFDLTHDLLLDGGLRWVDRRRLNNSGVPAYVPPFAEADLSLNWHVYGPFTFSVVGQNLLHDHHPEYGLPGPTRDEIERSVFAKIIWRM